jgi:hypothetical protein
MPDKNVNLRRSDAFQVRTHVLNFGMTWERSRRARRPGLFKKLTPYIIIWLAGFCSARPHSRCKKIRLKKTGLRWVSVHDTHSMQGCQMVGFQTKNPHLGKFSRALDWKMLIYSMAVWSNSWTFEKFYDYLVHFFPVLVWQPWFYVAHWDRR